MLRHKSSYEVRNIGYINTQTSTICRGYEFATQISPLLNCYSYGAVGDYNKNICHCQPRLIAHCQSSTTHHSHFYKTAGQFRWWDGGVNILKE